jgi:hypothetical protein
MTFVKFGQNFAQMPWQSTLTGANLDLRTCESVITKGQVPQ